MELQVNILVDFAPHKLEADKLLKDAHLFCVDYKYKEATEKVELAIAELRLMRAALKSHE
jgi:hypothetical protein